MEVTFFRTAAHFRRWLERHHDSATEVFVGFYRKHAGKTGISYDEALDEALCFGWIDGVRRTVDAERYTSRFSPRKPRSNWSTVNIKRVEALIAGGRMAPAGLRAFERRDLSRTRRYSYEQRPQTLTGAYAKQFKAVPDAWTFFQSQPPSYQRAVTWFVVSAVKDETRQRRLQTLIEESRRKRRLGILASKAGK